MRVFVIDLSDLFYLVERDFKCCLFLFHHPVLVNGETENKSVLRQNKNKSFSLKYLTTYWHVYMNL